ncbi:hypothetical protein OCU04_005825 [Sclerotinia nivalis]|uniref:Ras modification protein ERF4 n=1 Tax=Sclerotinia nivalis TaxID=352851 RepID=A0A9X0ALR4_9HELO|nr:hypothetical protein OCU04_005825 [Sclerotinia nivalis]
MIQTTEISGISSHLTQQANQKLQFLQNSYPTASQCIKTTNRANAPPSATGNARIPSPSHQPPYPSPTPGLSNPDQPQVRVSSPTRWSWRNALPGAVNTGAIDNFPNPFRSRAGSGSVVRGRPRRPSTSRLWNPTNSTPRAYPQTPKRHQSPQGQPVIAIPLQHPDISNLREGAGAGGDYPLLTLPEQRQQRHSASTKASLQVDRSGSSLSSHRISLPRTVSIDLARSRKSGDSPLTPTPGSKLDKGKGKAVEEKPAITVATTLERLTGRAPEGRQLTPTPVSGISFDFSKAAMSTDLERGPNTLNPYNASGTSPIPHANDSNTSLPGDIGPALSSNGTSIVGEEPGEGDDADEWGPHHPCYPHMNPHVPLSSPLYTTTRIIRIRRDWMLEGDLAPTFSNLYPEILDPAGVTEQEFRGLIERINGELLPAFNPWGARNIFDGVMGLVTGWMWDDLGWTGVKSRLNRVEMWLEEWNRDMESRAKEPGTAPKIVSLRRTGYMNLDIQVPDPEISYPATIPESDRLNSGISQNTQNMDPPPEPE